MLQFIYFNGCIRFCIISTFWSLHTGAFIPMWQILKRGMTGMKGIFLFSFNFQKGQNSSNISTMNIWVCPSPCSHINKFYLVLLIFANLGRYRVICIITLIAVLLFLRLNIFSNACWLLHLYFEIWLFVCFAHFSLGSFIFLITKPFYYHKY